VTFGRLPVLLSVAFSFQIDKALTNGVKFAFVSDAQNLRIPSQVPELQEGYDAVFSNAALHWCKRDPLGVVQGVRRALKPGGRFVAEMGGFMNCIGKFKTIVKGKGTTYQPLSRSKKHAARGRAFTRA